MTHSLPTRRSSDLYCYRKALVFAKSSLLFVPTSAVFFKKRRYWASDEEVSLQEEYRKGTLTKSPNTFDTIFDGAEFHQTVLQQKQLMGDRKSTRLNSSH